MQNDLISKELNFYQQCDAGKNTQDLASAMTAYVMINTSTIPSLAASFVNERLNRDGKNRKTVPDAYGVGESLDNPASDSMDDYYIKSLILVINDFLNDMRDSLYYQMYCQTVALFLISKGLKDYVDQIDFPDDIRDKTQTVLITLDDRLQGLVVQAKKKCQELQPELFNRFVEIDINLINEATNSVIYRWFTTEEGIRLINDDLITVLQGLRAEYLRIVKRNGEVEVSLLLELFGMNSTTYTRYRKDMIKHVADKCDSSLISYIKYLFLNKDN